MRTRRTPEQIDEDRLGLMRTLERLGEATFETLTFNGHVRYCRNDLVTLQKLGLVKQEIGHHGGMYFKKRTLKYSLTEQGKIRVIANAECKDAGQDQGVSTRGPQDDRMDA